jgi:diguanylate cyclase (GGDEF)-like protein
VGRFNASFKNIVPLFDEEGHFLGAVELIRFLDGLDVQVDKMLGTTSVLLVDKRFKGQLKYASATRFYGDYLVADHPFPGYVDLLRRIDVKAQVKEALQHKGVWVSTPKTLPEWVVAIHVVRDLSGNPMLYWLSLKPRDALIEQGSAWAVYKWWVVAGLLSVLVFLTGGFIYLRKKEAVEREFFQTVVDNTAELLCVIDGHRLIMANKSFINLFEGCHSVSDFERKYGTLCAVFNSESLACQNCDPPEKCYANLIEKAQQESFYLRLSLDEAPALSERSQKIFQVRATSFKSFEHDTWYVLVMTDVTELEETKRELEQLSIIDTLTQTYNRRYFNQVLESELRRSQRYDLPLSLVMFDIDHFKNINDTYGHDVGDQVLQKITQTVLAQIRETDVLCRIGGEEFVVILPETELQQAHALAERIRLAVAEMDQTEVPCQITVSLGVLQAYKWDSVQTLYKRLDEALYRAKEKGRNRTEVAISQNASETCQLKVPFKSSMDKSEQEN